MVLATSFEAALITSTSRALAWRIAEPHFAKSYSRSRSRDQSDAVGVGVTAVAGIMFGQRLSRRSRNTPRAVQSENNMFVPGNATVALEVLGGSATKSAKGVDNLSLVFVHGSYHAAWCYDQFFLDFFREKGFNAYALSLRGQGKGTMKETKPVAGTLEEHAADVASFVADLERQGQRVVLLGHSFGGLITLQAAENLKNLAGLILLCSVPPSGNVGIILRSLFRSPLQAFRITWGFISRSFESDADLCREARATSRYQSCEVHKKQHMTWKSRFYSGYAPALT